MIQTAFSSKEDFAKVESEFWAWYAKEFYRAWFNFASAFPKGSNWKSFIDNWTELGTLMTTEQNPYFLLLEKMGSEFKSITSQIDLEPSWATSILALKEIKHLAETEVKKDKGSLLAKLSLTKEKLVDKFDKSADKVYENEDQKKEADLEFKMVFAQVWNEYLDSLKTLSSATSYTEKSYYMFADFFKALNDPGKQTAPYNLTYDNLLKLKAFLKQHDTSPVVEGLLQGPFDFLTAYGAHQATIHLQKKWEEVVLSAAYSVDPEKYYTIMFDKNEGIIWKYVNEEAGAFITQTKTGFSAKKAFGVRLPFSNDFLKLLNKGEQLTLDRQSEYPVAITTLPISVNDEAMIRPFSNRLTMECADEKTVLLNENFPETQDYIWRPSICGDVTLEIKFEESLLQRKYKGRMGFAQFLSDFKDGTKIFNVNDFPEHKGYLANNNVTDITISYKINGIKPVLDFFERRPPSIPEGIFRTYKPKKGKFPFAVRKTTPADEKKVKAVPPPMEFEDKYAIAMETLPMEVNKDADVKPVASILWMKCKNEVIRFENNNYPETIKFDWEPEFCEKLILIVQFQDS